MKYMVLRINDERSSELCKRIESYALNRGGLEFPFSFENYYYDSNTLTAGLATYGESYTRVFHDNCRCSLIPLSDDVIWRIKNPDETDLIMNITGALSEANLEKAVLEDDITKDAVARFSSTKVFALTKLYLTKLVD